MRPSPPLSRLLSIVLATLIAVSSCFGQAPSAAPAQPPAPALPGSPLTVFVLDGKNAVNSIPMLRAVAPVVEIRDQNDFPVEGATVVFTVPAQGPGGTFAAGGNTFTARSDARGQATTPAMTPRAAGKFDIVVVATLGTRKGQTTISQTNAMTSYSGAALPPPPRWYQKKLTWAIAGGAVVATVIVLVKTSGSGTAGSAPVVITPGAPVFQ